MPGSMYHDREVSLLRHLERMGATLLNPLDAQLVCRNKIWQLQELTMAGLPVPDTLSYATAPLEIRTPSACCPTSRRPLWQACIRLLRHCQRASPALNWRARWLKCGSAVIWPGLASLHLLSRRAGAAGVSPYVGCRARPPCRPARRQHGGTGRYSKTRASPNSPVPSRTWERPPGSAACSPQSPVARGSRWCPGRGTQDQVTGSSVGRVNR